MPDGEVTNADEKTRVATQIKTIHAKSLYTHCYNYGRALNLEIGKLVKKDKVRQNMSRGKNESRGVHKWSDLTCTKKYSSTEGPKPGGGGVVNIGHSLSHFVLATGLLRPEVKCANVF